MYSRRLTQLIDAAEVALMEAHDKAIQEAIGNDEAAEVEVILARCRKLINHIPA